MSINQTVDKTLKLFTRLYPSAMSDNVITYTVDGEELSFDADDVATCLGRLGDGPVNGDYAICGDVMVIGDTFDDTDVVVAHVDNVKSCVDGVRDYCKTEEYWFTNTESLREDIEELNEESFEDYVRDIDGVLSINEYETTDSGNVKVTSWCFDGGELSALHEDDGTNVLSVDEDDGDVTILVQDIRDE